MAEHDANQDEESEARHELWRSRLRTALRIRGLDLEDVSVKSGNSPQYLSKVLNGRFNPTVARLQKICDAAQVDVAYLFTPDGAGTETIDVIRKAATLGEREGELVRQLIESAKPNK